MIRELIELMPEDVRQKWAEEEKQQAKLMEQMRMECAESLPYIGDAIRSPKISRSYLEEAQKHLMRAMSIAAVLDPE